MFDRNIDKQSITVAKTSLLHLPFCWPQLCEDLVTTVPSPSLDEVGRLDLPLGWVKPLLSACSGCHIIPFVHSVTGCHPRDSPSPTERWTWYPLICRNFTLTHRSVIHWLLGRKGVGRPRDSEVIPDYSANRQLIFRTRTFIWKTLAFRYRRTLFQFDQTNLEDNCFASSWLLSQTISYKLYKESYLTGWWQTAPLELWLSQVFILLSQPVGALEWRQTILGLNFVQFCPLNHM